MGQLQAVCCYGEQNERKAWCRVWTHRDGYGHISDLSWPLARRILPRLLAKYAAEMPAGFWWGMPVEIGGAS